MSDPEKTEDKLLQNALKTKDNAFVLWGFRVGAAVLAEDDKIYGGCNGESWVSGLGICAERCAINHAVLHGNRKIKEIAILVDADSQCEPTPCGACLQSFMTLPKTPKLKLLRRKRKKT